MTGGAWTEWTDGAVRLLRRSPAEVWLVWALSTLPWAYLLGRFLLEASFDAYFPGRAGLWALGLALAYWGKHIGEAVLARRLYRELGGDPPPLGWRGVLMQGAVQPTALLVVPFAALLMFPLAPAITFYRVLSVVPSPRRALRLASREWMAQSWELSAVTVAGLMLWVNLLILWLLLPMLARALFGVETNFGRLGEKMLNLSALIVTALGTWAVLDPLLTATAVLRAFREDARHSGVDLLAGLRRLAAVAMLAVALAGMAVPARAADPGPGAAVPAGEQELFEKQVVETLREPRYAFRLPKAEAAEANRSLLDRTLDWMSKQVDGLFAWLRELRPKDKPAESKPLWGAMDPMTAAIGIGVLVAVGLAGYFWMVRRKGTPPAARPVGPTLPAVPDLRREDLSPDALPEDEWLAMAEAMAARGELRLAMRALHLAGLRRLGERGLVTLAPSKSGGEYRSEVERRSRQQPAIVAGFGSALRRFEAAWYGFAAPGPADWEAARSEWQGVRAHVG